MSTIDRINLLAVILAMLLTQYVISSQESVMTSIEHVNEIDIEDIEYEDDVQAFYNEGTIIVNEVYLAITTLVSLSLEGSDDILIIQAAIEKAKDDLKHLPLIEENAIELIHELIELYDENNVLLENYHINSDAENFDKALENKSKATEIYMAFITIGSEKGIELIDETILRLQLLTERYMKYE